jgi:tetratricopeptide (TPR) repeat protein
MPLELDSETYSKIEKLSINGNACMDKEEWSDAIHCYEEALDLVPTPRTEWETATWLYASIGDAEFLAGNYGRAKTAMFDAMNCPCGQDNPFVHLRLGQAFFELGEMENSRKHLLSAYMLEGDQIFESDDPKYLESIADLK